MSGNGLKDSDLKTNAPSMNEEWLYLMKRYSLAGARDRFESICTSLLKRLHSDHFTKSVKVEQGDGGIDVFIGDIAGAPVKVFQCKFFINGINLSQKDQIRKSFASVMDQQEYRCSAWTLCLPCQLTLKEQLWWSEWQQKMTKAHQLGEDFIQLMDGEDLLDGLKTHGLYDEVFDVEIRTLLREIKELLTRPSFDLRSELARASQQVSRLKNYFADSVFTHVPRKESNTIVEWANGELEGHDPLERVLVVKGKKGMGKSTVLKDVYSELASQGQCLILAIKCDRCYDLTVKGLYDQLFLGHGSFREFIAMSKQSRQPFVVILDQLDALSQGLSNERRWMKTYLDLIDDLLDHSHVRIVLSSRTFDLDYDADLHRFSKTSVIKHIEVDRLSQDEVLRICSQLGFPEPNAVLRELLSIPYNLELFTKIPDIAGLLGNAKPVLPELYAELWKQVLSAGSLKLVSCLDVIISRMYEMSPNLASNKMLEEYKKEIDFLISHEILVSDGDKLWFFHQSFYEYYLARWFVATRQDLMAYIIESRQSLYIRPLVKSVIELLRETDHGNYIELYKKVVTAVEIRYNLKYLFIVTLGEVSSPTIKEKQFLREHLENEMGFLFLDMFTSGGWLEFLMNSRLLNEKRPEYLGLLWRNLNFCPLLMLEYVQRQNPETAPGIIARLLPSVSEWSPKLLPFFDKYYLYNEDNELWYFEMLKKIALVDFGFALEKLGPVVLAQRKNRERIKFDYRYDRIIDELYKISPKQLTDFLLSLQLKILEESKYPYYGFYSDIQSPLLSSTSYDNGLNYKDSEDEKSIDFYLVDYYRKCDLNELMELFELHGKSDFVVLLNVMAKVLRHRADEFVPQIVDFVENIAGKNGLLETDDFFQLNIRRLIAKVVGQLDCDGYTRIRSVVLTVSHPYEVWKYEEEGKKRYSLSLGKKKFLFLKAWPKDVLDRDLPLKRIYQELWRKYGDLDHNKAMDRNNSRSGAVRSPISGADFSRFNDDAWIKSMVKINGDFKSSDFFKGGLLEHARVFEAETEKKPSRCYGLIEKLFDLPEVSPSYISHGISGLIKANYDIERIQKLILKEISLPLDSEYTLYATWHTRHLIFDKLLTREVVDFWLKIIDTKTFGRDVLNEDNPVSDFINTPRGSAVYNLMHAYGQPEYAEDIMATVEKLVHSKAKSSNTILCGIMANLAYLNHLDLKRSFKIFLRLARRGDAKLLKHSINPAQYFNNKYHWHMGAYFDRMLGYPELYGQCYFFVSSWIYSDIDDFDRYDDFMDRGEAAISCALEVGEDFLIRDGSIDQRALEVLMRCLKSDGDHAHNLSTMVLRKFEVRYFLQLKDFIESYIATKHFAEDPRYLLKFLTECSAAYPLECLKILQSMQVPENVDISKRGYLNNEPLVLVLAIYSRLRDESGTHEREQDIALDIFDKMLTMPNYRQKAFSAMESILD